MDNLDDLILDKQGEHKGGRPKGRTLLATEEIKTEILEIFCEGNTDNTNEIWDLIKLKHPGVGKGLVIQAKQEFREMQISKLNLKKQDFYIKDSLIEYDRLMNNAKQIEEDNLDSKPFVSIEAQKNILESIKQRNSLLGVDKSHITTEINFNANVSDDDFINGVNITDNVIDINIEETQVDKPEEPQE